MFQCWYYSVVNTSDVGKQEDTEFLIYCFTKLKTRYFEKKIVCVCPCEGQRTTSRLFLSCCPPCILDSITQWTRACQADYASLLNMPRDLLVPTSSAWQQQPDPGALDPSSGEGVCLSPGYLWYCLFSSCYSISYGSKLYLETISLGRWLVNQDTNIKTGTHGHMPHINSNSQ